jgi:hypothetical protein
MGAVCPQTPDDFLAEEAVLLAREANREGSIVGFTGECQGLAGFDGDYRTKGRLARRRP